jgi:hypothetical protein
MTMIWVCTLYCNVFLAVSGKAAASMFSVIKHPLESNSLALKLQKTRSSEMWKQTHYIRHFGSNIRESLQTYQIYVSLHQVHSSNPVVSCWGTGR